ncbi:hypothetical protein CAEBREN_23462 [Caenorhabditis brenneri]|uniref:Protein kinase domain-containing protein n=1 Tax=Caenorhabditis brenneri TaxID=135651 RepID=G0NIN8_CAEBE|nr:hypothetical protein CAEBREN_23462 [Caenorhabditis brenneri]
MEPENRICDICADSWPVGYKVEGFIGKGSFGKVFRVSGHPYHPTETIAVKEFPTSILFDDKTLSYNDAREKFKEGMWFDKGTQYHPYVIAFANRFFVSHGGTRLNSDGIAIADGHAYIEMEECHQKTLADWLQENMNVRPIKIMKIWIRQLLSALEFIHDQGVIHRDLKPQNIFFKRTHGASYGLDGNLKIGDFGMIKRCFDEDDQVEKRLSSREIREHNKFYGTPMYNAPEKSTKKYNNKVDVFSLGLIAAELIIPMKKERVRDAVFEILKAGNLPKLVAQQPIEVRNFIMLATKPEPELRPFAAELLEHDFFEDTKQKLRIVEVHLSKAEFASFKKVIKGRCNGCNKTPCETRAFHWQKM